MEILVISLVILVFLIVTHELGHFITAKLFGVKVEEFGLGYPPRALFLGTFGGTAYTINWLPFGGFVRLAGEAEGSERSRGSFAAAPRWQQAIILLAGVGMNVLGAWILFAAAFHAGFPQLVDQSGLADGPAKLIISNVIVGSPADVAGLKSGDYIVAVSDTAGAVPEALSPEALTQFVQARGGKRITIDYVAGAATSSATMIPANAVIPDAAGRPALGIGLELIQNVSLPWHVAFARGGAATVHALEDVVQSLGQMITQSMHHRSSEVLQNVVGPIGLYFVVNDAAHNGLGELLALAAFIAVNLAVVNLIPIPALDGGRLVLVAIEAVIRREVPQLAVQILNLAGMSLIVLLALVVSYHDIIVRIAG